MMSEDQSVLLDGRNVHFFDGSTGDMLGGLFQNGTVTQGNFISMLNIVLVPHPLIKPRTFMVKARSRQTLSLTNQRLTPGDYDIYAPDGCRCIDSRSKERKTQLTWIGSIKLSDEPVVRRLPPYRVGGRETDFDRGMRARDGKCVVTGTVNLAAHVVTGQASRRPVYSLWRKRATGLNIILVDGSLIQTLGTILRLSTPFRMGFSCWHTYVNYLTPTPFQ
jgi:hypothetical protein